MEDTGMLKDGEMKVFRAVNKKIKIERFQHTIGCLRHFQVKLEWLSGVIELPVLCLWQGMHLLPCGL